MQEAYKNVDIQFLPDRVINDSNLLDFPLKQISLNLFPTEQLNSNLIISSQFDSVQEITHSLTQQLESYIAFVSNLSF
jgi:hypothetical protein